MIVRIQKQKKSQEDIIMEMIEIKNEYDVNNIS
jgi:hypothetical protein